MTKDKQTVQILATPKGGHTAFFTVPAADAQAAGLQSNEHGVIGAGYDEIAVGVDYARANPTPFPGACPRCGAERLFDSGGDTVPTATGRPRTRAGRPVYVPTYARKAAYACGGTYEMKSQCQNHTDKWGGALPGHAGPHRAGAQGERRRGGRVTCPLCGGALDVQRDVTVDEPYVPRHPLRDAPVLRRQRVAVAVAFCGTCEFAAEVDR